MNEFRDAPYRLAKMNAPVLYVVRHGSTGTDDTYNGPENPDLDEKGLKDAEDAAKFLSGRPTGNLISSAMLRAVKTAQIIGRGIGKTPSIKPDLDSLDVGSVASMDDKDEADKVIKHHQDNPSEVIPEGESIQQFQSRIHPQLMKSIGHFFQTGLPDVLSVHHSVQHEVGNFFNGDKDSALTEPGGVIAVYQREPGKFEAVPVFRRE